MVVALPASIDLLIRNFATSSLIIIPPGYVEFRSNTPVQIKNDQGDRLNHRGGQRAINAKASAGQHLHAVVPVTFRNDGFEGSELSVRVERLILVSQKYPQKRFQFDAVFNTEIVPADSTHWWWGNVKPWLPTVLDGGESRSSEVIFKAKGCASEGCRWSDFLKFLHLEKESYDVIVEVELLNGDIFKSDPCELVMSSVLASNANADTDRKRYYRRSAACQPQNS